MDSPEDGTNSDSQRSSAAQLIGVLEAMLLRLPESPSELNERLDSALLIRDGLAEFDLDAESLVRYAMSGHVALTLIAAILIRPIASVGSPDSTPINIQRWRELLHVPRDLPSSGLELSVSDQTRDGLQAQLTRMRPIIVRWVECAPYEEIVVLAPPSETALSAYQLAAKPETDVVAAYTWILQRSTSDEPRHWANASLFHEFRFQEGETRLDFNAVLLRDGSMEPQALHYEIARRAASPDPEPTDSYDPLVWQLQEQAQTFLRQNRYAEAGALFEFYHRLHPESPQALNNLAFCKMPIDPAGSLQYLQEAARVGYSPLTINVYNQCCCLSMLSREGEALDRAEYYWQRQYEENNVGGLLWSRNGEVWELYREQDPRLALAQLAQDIAESIGRSDRELVWQQRGATLRSVWTAAGETYASTSIDAREDTA